MSDGRFSEKPLRSERIRPFARGAGEFSAEPTLAPDAARAFLQAPAVRHEVDALTAPSASEFAPTTCSPLPKYAPAGVLDLGKPLASATLVQEYLIGLIFLRVCGWIFMAFGALILLGAIIVAVVGLERHDGREPHPLVVSAMMAEFGIAIGGAGVWFGIYRGRVINEMCWFCPRGMVWMIEGHFELYTWDQIRDVYCAPDAERPAVGISLGRNLSWISFSNTPASRDTVEAIEKQASAFCLHTILPLFADGKTLRFGKWRLSRFSILDAGTEFSWRDVIELDCTPGEVFIRNHDNAKLFVRLEDIPFPSMFTALTRAAFGYAREQTS